MSVHGNISYHITLDLHRWVLSHIQTIFMHWYVSIENLIMQRDYLRTARKLLTIRDTSILTTLLYKNHHVEVLVRIIPENSFNDYYYHFVEKYDNISYYLVLASCLSNTSQLVRKCTSLQHGQSPDFPVVISTPPSPSPLDEP